MTTGTLCGFGHEAERVYSALGERDEDRDLRRLAELVGRKGGAISPRDLMLANRRRYPTTDAAEAALDALAGAGGRTCRAGRAAAGRSGC